jgi:hypothetical protein
MGDYETILRHHGHRAERLRYDARRRTLAASADRRRHGFRARLARFLRDLAERLDPAIRHPRRPGNAHPA